MGQGRREKMKDTLKQARAINGLWVALFSPHLSSLQVKQAVFL